MREKELDKLAHLDGGDVREKMINFIRRHFSDILGEDVKYLDTPGGLDILHSKYCKRS